VTADVGNLNAELVRQGESGVLILGYPVWVHVPTGQDPENEAFFKPVFTYTLDFDSRPTSIRVSRGPGIPEINYDWLRFALKRPDQQRKFLEAVGLISPWDEDEAQSRGARESLEVDLRSLARGLMTYFPEAVQETIDPSATRPFRAVGARSGIYNHAIIMTARRTKFSQTLLKELSRIRDVPDEELASTALASVFDMGAVDDSAGGTQNLNGAGLNEGRVVDVVAMNAEQRAATASLLSAPLTVITGPPGTGKSQLVRGTVLNCRLWGETVLVASRNHQAIDAVVNNEALVADDGMPMIARANSKERDVDFRFRNAIEDVLSSEHDPEAAGSRAGEFEKLRELLDERGEISAAALGIQKKRDALADLQGQLDDFSASWSEREACELELGSGWFPSTNVKRLTGRLSGPTGSDSTDRLATAIDWLRSPLRSWSLWRVNKSFASNFTSWLGPLAGLKDSDARVRYRANQQLSDAVKFCGVRRKAGLLEEETRELPEYGDLVGKIDKLSSTISELGAEVLRFDTAARQGIPASAGDLRTRLDQLRVGLQHLAGKMLKGGARNEIEGVMDRSLPELLKHFPAWASTNLSVGSRIPLRPGLFDLVVIDEASQCDIPSAIPVLFRGRRAGIVGDPNQLRHIVNMTDSQDVVLFNKNGITSMSDRARSFKHTSLYGLAASSSKARVLKLREHYRSHASIAGLINRNFYGFLRVATAADKLRVPAGWKSGIQWTHVVSRIEGRASGCAAPDEVAAVLRLLRELVLDSEFRGTVGIVTPFRWQKNLIEEELARTAELAYAAHACGIQARTVHEFQGDEKDVVLFSLCGGPDMPASSLRWFKANWNLFNVAVSRAKAVLHVIGNREWARDSRISHLADLATEHSAPVISSELRFESPWERKFHEKLLEAGIETLTQYPLLGRRLDLALVDNEGRGRTPIDIEVDGLCHQDDDGSRKRDDHWRDIQIRGAGWKVRRFWAYELRENMDACVQKVVKEWRQA